MTETISQRGDRLDYDVVVLGSGIAGLTYILDLLEKRPETRVALLAKKDLLESNSFYAQGGLAAAQATPDAIAAHVRDTISAGAGLCHASAVTSILTDAPNRIQDLHRRAVDFDRTSTNTFDLGLEGGHADRRIYRSGDRTGEMVVRKLAERVLSMRQVEVFANTIAINLITQSSRLAPGEPREVIGLYALNIEKQNVSMFLSKIVVLATGGAGKVYRYTTNPETATGDGVAMAYRAGARVGNLEFYQFHPTLLFHPKVNHFLISEGLRGEGARLLLPSTGERFMERYEPKDLELATRDKVARAIFTEMEKTGQSFVYLDIRHKGRAFLEKRFPKIDETLLSLGIDMAKDLIPVVPGAHYWCGGVLTNVAGQTDLTRLYAIGETAFTGLHGANRLASNSLTEGLVMAHAAALSSVALLEQSVALKRELNDWDSMSVTDLRRASQINAHWRGLRGEMTSYAGIVRTEAGLRDLLDLTRTRRQMIETYYWNHTITRDLLELRNIVLLAELIAHAALHRRESRGVHFREDFPHPFAQAEDSILRYHEAFPLSRAHQHRAKA